MSINEPNTRWSRLLLGRLTLRACHLGTLKAKAPECDCRGGRCPFQTYCMSAKLEHSAAARLEKWFWRVIFGGAASLTLYMLVRSA